jgi:hypothetical protein
MIHIGLLPGDLKREAGSQVSNTIFLVSIISWAFKAISIYR